MYLPCEISAANFGQIEIIERKTHGALPHALCRSNNTGRQGAFPRSLATADPQHSPGWNRSPSTTVVEPILLPVPNFVILLPVPNFLLLPVPNFNFVPVPNCRFTVVRPQLQCCGQVAPLLGDRGRQHRGEFGRGGGVGFERFTNVVEIHRIGTIVAAGV